MTPLEQEFLIWSLLALLAILAWVGQLAVGKLSKIADSVGSMEKDLGVLANDHTNLKDSHDDLKERVKQIEHKIFA